MNSLNNADLLPDSVKQIVEIIVKTAKPKKLMLFGSRARGTHRSNSDVDLVVFAKSCSEPEWTQLLIDISEGPYSLYAVDLVEYENLGPEYQKNISHEGKLLYECRDKF